MTYSEVKDFKMITHIGIIITDIATTVAVLVELLLYKLGTQTCRNSICVVADLILLLVCSASAVVLYIFGPRPWREEKLYGTWFNLGFIIARYAAQIGRLYVTVSHFLQRAKIVEYSKKININIDGFCPETSFGPDSPHSRALSMSSSPRLFLMDYQEIKDVAIAASPSATRSGPGRSLFSRKIDISPKKVLSSSRNPNPLVSVIDVDNDSNIRSIPSSCSTNPPISVIGD